MICNDKDGNYVVDVQLLIDEDDGVISCEDTDGPESIRQRAVKVRIVLPKNFFEPVRINVDFPPELLADKVVDGYVNQLEVPIEVNGKRGKLNMEEALSGGRGSGIMAVIRKMVLGGNKDEYKK